MTNRGSRAIEVALLFGAGALLLAFWDHLLLWPLKITVVLFHELGHALAAWVTGGTVLEIGLNPNQGGVTVTTGGARFLILNAGYLGSLAWGMFLLATTRSARSARPVATALAVVFGVVAVLFVRPIVSFGFGFTLVAALAMALLGRAAPAEATRLALRSLGVFSVLYALFDIRDDVFRAGPEATTDATMLAEATGIPAVLWGGAWLLAGVFVLWVFRRRLA